MSRGMQGLLKNSHDHAPGATVYVRRNAELHAGVPAARLLHHVRCSPLERKEGSLAQLEAISKSYEGVKTHVVFVHGLSGDIRKTWMTKSSVLWPTWLEEDLPSLGVWLVGYPAAATSWTGHALPLSDRADNILARLLVEPRLERGYIVFVTHSLGGLVVEQLIRNADRDSGSVRKVEDFLSRVKRVALLGTPHRGAVLANAAKALSFIFRPSAAIHDLPLGDPQLRDLNHWYRRFSRDRGIENLVLAEGLPEKLLGVRLPAALGTVVSISSADAGVSELPITVDESHKTICKPETRDADVYAHVKGFVSRPFDLPPQPLRAVEVLERHETKLDLLVSISQEQGQAIKQFAGKLGEERSISVVDTTILDHEAGQQLEHLRKCRLFGGFDTIGATRRLLTSLVSGSLSLASSTTKSEAIMWCARFLAAQEGKEASIALAAAASPTAELEAIAKGFIAQSQGRLQEALEGLAKFDSPLSRGAAYICVLKERGFAESTLWLEQAGLTSSDIDSDAKFFYIGGALENAQWGEALDAASLLSRADFDRSPALAVAAAHANLVRAVPDELRTHVLRNLPMDAATFPLRSEPENFVYRRAAAALFDQIQDEWKGSGMPPGAERARDFGLWLRLRDPETTASARVELTSSIREAGTLLRRLNLALQFGVQLDLARVEKEVDRQTALSGGTSADAAAARLALAFAKSSCAETAGYIATHREQLLTHLEWKGVYLLEIEALVKSNQIDQAHLRLQEATDRGLSSDEVDWFRRAFVDSPTTDPVAGLLSSYQSSGSLADLRILVGALEEAQNWEKLVPFGKRLLDETGEIGDAQRYAVALYNLQRLEEVLAQFDTYPTLRTQEGMSLLRARTLYELGRFDDAKLAVDQLPIAATKSTKRQLQIGIAVASGDWESLQAFVEDEWSNRQTRSPIELLQVGRLAFQVGAARAKEFVHEAAHRAPDDPIVLASCYQAATAGGWEADDEVHQWLARAASLSEDNSGPIQKISLETLSEQSPTWEKHDTETWAKVVKGEAPLFIAARALNRSLLRLLLLPALSSRDEADVRKRPFAFAFSGSRGTSSCKPRTVALDPTALVTATLLGLFEVYLDAFDAIVVPHGTLSWLLEERAQISFHQPSRIVAARELRRLIAEGALRQFDTVAPPPQSLVIEVGESLAELLTDAASKSAGNVQTLVIRGGPIHRVSTFLKEEADLSAFTTVICSTTDVVEKLAQKGVLSATETESAREYLRIRELPWPSPPAIEDGATILLDDVAASHLANLNLLPRLYRATLKAVISRSEVAEADSLISLATKSAEALDIIDQLRSHIRSGIRSGKVLFGPAVRPEGGDETPRGMLVHPTAAALRFLDQVEAVVIDDRAINQHGLASSNETTRPLLTTLDILHLLERSGAISTARWRDARTTLRRLNFALVPLDTYEVLSLLDEAPLVDGTLVETAELRALRESVQRLRMTDVVQIPREAIWLDGVTGSLLHALQVQWHPLAEQVRAAAASDWLLELGDVRGWTHRLNEDAARLASRYLSWLEMLMLAATGQPQRTREAYWAWLSARILDPLAEEDADTYSALCEKAKSLVASLISRSSGEQEIE